MTPRPYLTPPEAAPLAGVTRQCVTTWCAEYPGLATRVAGRWRIDPDALKRLLEGHPPSERNTQRRLAK